MVIDWLLTHPNQLRKCGEYAHVYCYWHFLPHSATVNLIQNAESNGRSGEITAPQTDSKSTYT